LGAGKRPNKRICILERRIADLSCGFAVFTSPWVGTILTNAAREVATASAKVGLSANTIVKAFRFALCLTAASSLPASCADALVPTNASAVIVTVFVTEFTGPVEHVQEQLVNHTVSQVKWTKHLITAEG